MSSPVDRLYYSLRSLRRLLALWRHPNRRFLAYPPGHFASPLPDHASIECDHSRLTAVHDVPGIELNVDAQLQLLRAIAPAARAIDFPDRATDGFRYHFENAFFSYGDALFLAGMIQHFRPKRVIEIGSGFSSALMLDLRQRTDWTAELTFVEPFPVRLNALLAAADRSSCRVIESKVQDVPLDRFRELDADDLLFIDSSHVAKIGSDVNHLVFEVLPILKPGVLVQIHDIFWPFEYPKAWYDLGWAWNEAYLVRALLVGGRRYRIELFPSYLEARHGDELNELVPRALQRAAATPATGASSLWLRVQG